MIKIKFDWLRTCIELPTMLVLLSFTIAQTVTYNFIMYRSCYVDFNFNRTLCERLGTGDNDTLLAEIEKTVQSQVSVNFMVQELIHQVAPVFLCLLLGPWSDSHGRRPILNCALFGFSIGGLLALIVIFVENLSAWWFAAMSIIIAAFGGVTTFFTAVVCYISDITTEENRGTRMAVFEGLMAVGVFLGTASTSYVYNAGGYGLVFGILVASFIAAFLYHYFFMAESLQFNEKGPTPKHNLFNVKHIKEMCQVTFKARPNNGRTVLILCVILSILVKFIGQADAPIYYLFLRLKFNWDMEKYTIFKAISSLLGIIIAIGGIALLHQKFKIREMPLVFVSGIVSMVAMILQGAAEDDRYIFVGGTLRAVAGLLSPMVRTLLSKLVNPDETGKVFALSSAVESLVLLCGLLGYTDLYQKTTETNPGAFNYITAAFYGAISLFAGWVLIVQRFCQKEDVFLSNNRNNKEADGENFEIN